MSTSNIQNYLSNVFRPAYRFDSNTGEFKAVLNMYNINELFANTFSVGQFSIGDSGGNVYLGSNAGNPTDTLQDCYRNVAVGTAAGSSISNVLDSVFIGYTAGANTSNASNIIAVGKGTVTGGSDTIYIGVSAGNATGSNNLFIGHNIAPAGTVNNQLRIGLDSLGQTVFNADLSLNRVGIFTSNPLYPIDLNGSTYIRSGLSVSGGLTVSDGLVSTSFMETKSDLYVRGGSYQNFIQSDRPVIAGGGFNQHIALANVSGSVTYWLWTFDTFTGPLGTRLNGDFGITARQIDNVASGATSRTFVPLFLSRNTGFVGLNTVTPSAGLHISQNVNFNFSNIPGILSDTAHIVMGQASNGNQRLAIGYNGSNSTGFIQAYTAGSGLNNFVINPNGGNLGVSTTTPAFTLDVSGTGRFTSNLGVSETLNVSGQTFFGSNVGIGTAAPSFPLDVAGTIRGSSNIVAVSVSSSLTTSSFTTIAVSNVSGYNVISINYTPKQTSIERIPLVVEGRVECQFSTGSSNDLMAYDLVRNFGLADQYIVGSYRYPLFDNTVVAASRSNEELFFQHPFGLVNVSSGTSTELSVRLRLISPTDAPFQIRKAHLSIMEISLI